ncbi:MAG: hypothetical protein Q8P24_00455 [Desulfobacterales bacterium]|nr:hypothetical protein [Desulfobacterales bacterium]
MKTGFYIAVFVLVLAAAVFVSALLFPFQQARLVPVTVSGMILILAAIQLAVEIRPVKPSGKMPAGGAAGFGSDFSAYFTEISWMAGFLAGIYLLGFKAAILLFGIAYMKQHGARWLTAVWVAAFLTLLSWGIFSLILDVTLYPGVLFKVFK